LECCWSERGALHNLFLRYNFGVRVSAIYPGAIDTAMARSIEFGFEIKSWWLPEHIANVVIFLLKTNKKVIIKDVIVDNMGV